MRLRCKHLWTSISRGGGVARTGVFNQAYKHHQRITSLDQDVDPSLLDQWLSPPQAVYEHSVDLSMATTTRAPVGGRKCRRHIHQSVGGGGLERLLELPSSRISGYKALMIWNRRS
jgi:hypothetical protein